MKNTLFVSVILLCTACTANKDALVIPGAYKMDSTSIKTSVSDTTYRNTNQLKIYTADFMMYADVNDGDSVSRFGIGTYSISGDTLTEKVIFSADDSVRNDVTATYKLFIEKTPLGYRQRIAGITSANGQTMDMTEYYHALNLSPASAMDGAWKLTGAYYVKGNDTAWQQNNMQYKLYHAGYIIWGHSMKDSAGKVETGVGFGRFKMQGDSTVKESMMTSTYSSVSGHDFDIRVERMGNDMFKQTITYDDGGKAVELYERIKK
jgi:hypothetical protein